MKNTIIAALCLFAGTSTAVPPAVPLVTVDPYTSVWSMTDKLTDSWPQHWTGGTMGMSGMVRVDGKTYRWCGTSPTEVEPAKQNDVSVSCSSTLYSFENTEVVLNLAFVTPMRMTSKLEDASRPATWVAFSAVARDGRPHDVSIYLDLSGEWCVHSSEQQVSWSREKLQGLQAISMGSVDQPVLARAGDGTRIDWGRLYLAASAADAQRVSLAIGADNLVRRSFAETGKLPAQDDGQMPRSANDRWPVLAAAMNLGKVGEDPISGNLFIAYDDQRSIQYFGKNLRPYWARNGRSIADEISALDAHARRPVDAADRTDALDVRGTSMIGGTKYYRMLSLAFRQVMAGHKIVADEDGTPLMFSKENTSNGCIATVDVIYPACPFFLYHSPEMLKAQLRPLLEYSKSDRWKFPFAPHDLGTYPKANGQVYGGGEKTENDQMPVEESGNMLIMLAALAKVEGNDDFSKPYLPVLARWADYLKENGLDPANQLCTDDFAGHLARNANLSAKTVVALGGYAQLLAAVGDKEGSERWMAVAKEFAAKWQELAKDGDATVLVFGQPGTWSQKYNLIWDRVLGLNLFPQSVFEREMALYRTKVQQYGLPLDSRKTYTKLDWTVWTACLTGKRADFDAIMKPVFGWVDAPVPPSRVPMSDWYETTDGKTMGMHTRTVVGGIWMPMLMSKLGVGLK